MDNSKNYVSPKIEIIKIEIMQSILAGSGTTEENLDMPVQHW